MSFVTPVTLNIQKPPEELLLDKINMANSLNLKIEDFTAGNPSIYVPAGSASTINTKVTFTPKVSSKFYNNWDVYYERMEIEPILSNSAVSVPRGDATQLSELIDSINELFGIHLTAADYVEVTLPAIDPLDPDGPVTVNVQIRGTSYLFKGNYDLVLNRVVVEPTSEDPEPSDIFMVIDQPGESVMKSDLKVVTSSGDPVTGFVFMRNAITKTLVQIDKTLLLANNDIVVFGQFDFNILVGNNNTNVVASCIVITPQGTIKRIATPADDFGYSVNQGIKYENRRGSAYVFGIDNGIIKRYSVGGVESAWTTVPLDYAPVLVKEDLDGKLYVVSPLYTAQVDTDNNPNTPTVPTEQSVVERLLSNGAIDVSFDRVVIRHTGIATPWPIASLALIELPSQVPGVTGNEASGFYLALIPSQPPSSLEDCPVINNVAVVPGGTSVEYGYVPMFRFTQSGVRDITFVVKQARYKPDSVYNEFESGLLAGSNAVVVQGKEPVFLTNRANPMTGHVHALPVRFKDSGEMQTIAGDYYFTAWRWKDVSDILKLSNGDMIVYGQAKVPLVDGTYSTDYRQIVASYNASTVPDSVLYQSMPLNANPTTIRSIFALQN